MTPLPADALRPRCDPDLIPFSSTVEWESSVDSVGQSRALDALAFGARVRGSGFNLYVLGPPGSGRHQMARTVLEREAAARPAPGDWCYLHNFASARRPTVVGLLPGRGRALATESNQLVEDLQAAVRAAFESEQYRKERAAIEETFRAHQEQALEGVQEEADEKGLTLLRTPQGLAIAPMKDGDVLSDEDFEALPEDQREEARQKMERLTEKLKARVEDMPAWAKERRRRIRELERTVVTAAVGHTLSEMRDRWSDAPAVQAWLEAIEADVREHARDFALAGEDGGERPQDGAFRRYRVNLLVDNQSANEAPVVYEPHPTYLNLVGRIEHEARMGTLHTDFTLISAGALHRANGGYLVLDAERLLGEPWAWQALKRALYSGELRLETLERVLGVMGTVSLEPEPAPLNVKVVLVGSRLLYWLLVELDADFPELFKVAADLSDRVDRSADNIHLYAGLVATLVRRQELPPFDRSAVARVVEHGARMAGGDRLSVRVRGLGDLLVEAAWLAGEAGRAVVTGVDVAAAEAAQLRRLDRSYEEAREEIRRGVVLVDTQGGSVGQVNGLSLYGFGDYWYGHPARITATVRVGEGKVLDIEREVELGGAIHSKGVLILSGFIAARYAIELPLSLAASLVVEQSYGGIDGDSATVAEACSLLSAIAGVPARQDLAVTGSMNQLGQVQAVGGINEKIESFFDVCRDRGLSGTQGVIVPADNVRHLMLRDDVVEAARDGRFHVYPVRTVDEAAAVLMSLEAGTRDAQGRYAEGSLNARVEARLKAFAEYRHEFEKEAVEVGEDGPADGR